MFSSLFKSGPLKTILALFTAIMMSLGLLTAKPLPKEGIIADAVMTFANALPGSAAGTLRIESNYDGDYNVFWGDASGAKLTAATPAGKTLPYSEFAEVTVSSGKGELATNPFLFIPPNAVTMLLYYGDTLLDTDEVPAGKQTAAAEPTYSFGSLSDVHFNRYDTTGGDDSELSYPRALNLLDEMGVSLVALAGDLSNKGEASSYEAFRKFNDQHDFPVYTCRGNHDCKNKFSYDAWKANVNVGVFEEEAPAGVLARGDNGFDFVYSGSETNGDVFIFLSQCRDSYLPGVRILEQSQLDWLRDQLEAHKNDRVYLYFHTFLNAWQGDFRMGEGNLANDYGYFYPLPYFKGNADEQQFRALLEEYKNVIFFNGHSHWAHKMESFNRNLNITDNNGTTATLVHISSVGAPRTTGILNPIQTSNPVTMSEGLFVSVFPQHIVTYAMDFANSRILAYATYRIAR